MRANRYLRAALAIWLAGCTPAGDESASGGGSGVAAEAVSISPGVGSTLLVSSEWLAGRLDDPRVVVLHVDTDRATYDRGHIAGARFLPVSSYVTTRGTISNELPSVAHLDSVFESVGVSDDSHVVIYGPPLAAARAFFTLDYLGHGDRTSLLDGGLQGWQAEGLPLTAEAPRVTRGNFTPRPRQELVVDASWVSAHLDDPRIALVDARPAAQYSGAEAGAGVPRPGHIPGAGNLFWERLIHSAEDTRLRDPETLRALFRAAGVEPGDTVVTYCRTGMQASFAYFISRYLGYETRIYDGSFMDWSRRAELPVER